MSIILSPPSPISSQKKLVAIIRKRWREAGGEVSRIRIDDLGFSVVNHKKRGSCDLTMRPNDKEAKRIQSFYFNTKKAVEVEKDIFAEGVFHVHRMGKRVFGNRKKPYLFSIVEMHGIDLKTGQGGDLYSTHRHDKGDAIFLILSGAGAIRVDEEWLLYKAGDKFSIPAGTVHGFVIDARAGKSAFFLREGRPINCVKDDGTEDSDFIPVPMPRLPGWVKKIHIKNLEAIRA